MSSRGPGSPRTTTSGPTSTTTPSTGASTPGRTTQAQKSCASLPAITGTSAGGTGTPPPLRTTPPPPADLRPQLAHSRQGRRWVAAIVWSVGLDRPEKTARWPPSSAQDRIASLPCIDSTAPLVQRVYQDHSPLLPENRSTL